MRFGGLSRRIYLAFLLAAVIPTALAGVIGIYYSLETLKRETLASLEQEVQIRTDNIARFFAQLSSELLYLTGAEPLDGLRQAIQVQDERSTLLARTQLEQDFMRFAAHYPHIYQIRYLMDNGMETVRVDRHGDQVQVVPPHRLQDKSDRYYVREASQLPPGEIYVSPLDLNVEFGQVEKPERPVIRFATRVPTRNGGTAGMLVVNLNADILLDQIQQMADARAGTAYLFDRSGHYLARLPGTPADQFTMQPVEPLTSAYGKPLIGKIIGGEQGTVATSGHILAFAPVRLLNGQPYQTSSRGWALALAFPENRLFLSVFNLSALYIVLLVSLAATALGGYVLSRRLIGPLDDLTRETEAIAGGDFTRRVRIEGNDEIAGLGNKFNLMAAHLQGVIGKLHTHQGRLEAEVNARTAELDRERSFLAAVIQHTGDGILAVDEWGTCLLVNGSATTLLGGLSSGQALDTCLPDWPLLATKAAAAGEHRCETVADNRTLALSITCTGEEASTGFVVVIRDVSEERRLADERRELDRQMFQVEKMATLGELAMGLAHEIGNPLAGMKAVVQTMRYDEEIPPYFLSTLERLEGEIDRLSGFLRTFHGFAAPQVLMPTACNLTTVLDDVLFWTKKESRNQHITLHTELADIPPLRADPHQIKQVLLNLVINAVHAMPQGGVLHIRAMPDGTDTVRIEVEDSGSGIPADILPRIFEPFFTTRSDGTGLGLAIVRKITQDHAARIRVDSTPGHGSCFTLYWPSARTPHD